MTSSCPDRNRISNSKQSAIFKISKHDADGVGAATITLGISIEPAQHVEAQLAQMPPNQPAPPTSVAVAKPQPPIHTLAQRIITHAFNFVSGFARPDGSIPLKAFETWWTKFSSKLENDPAFLERELH